ncbi:MAG: hypothetical protein AAB512_05045 [Patescibacteria group bacterium]
MYANVVVLTYQAPDTDSFSYEIPNELEKDIEIGQLVKVPFGTRMPMGVVVGLHKSLDIRNLKLKIKNLKSILISQPLLLPYQIGLAKWMSAYYFAPMVNCLNTILPELPSKLLTVYPDSRRVHGSWQKENKTINYELSTMNQHLILVPSINKIPETLAKFPKAKNHVVYHNELKASEKFDAWQKILSGEADYIFGSRSAIFTPCPNLKEIIIYDEHDSAYKDERSPYFDTLTVAQKISQLTVAQIKIVDPAPKITTYFQLESRIKIQTFPQKTQVVNLVSDKTSGNKSPISFDLEEHIGQTLEEKGAVLLFLNKKKESGHMFCKACKTSLYLEKQPNQCTNCNSPNIFWSVLNINSLATDVKNLFPQSKVNLITDNKQQTTNHELSTIDIGTAFALYSPLAKKYNLIAQIQTDSLLNVADHASGEKLFAQITSLKKILTPNGTLILQSYSVENPILNLVAHGDYKSFYLEELSQRKLLNNPPYSLLIKLTIKGKGDDKVKNEAESLAGSLPSTINHQPSTILGPYKPIFWQKLPVYHIILKNRVANYSLSDREKVINSIAPLLQKGSKKYSIEVEPAGIQ